MLFRSQSVKRCPQFAVLPVRIKFSQRGDEIMDTDSADAAVGDYRHKGT